MCLLFSFPAAFKVLFKHIEGTLINSVPSTAIIEEYK